MEKWNRIIGLVLCGFGGAMMSNWEAAIGVWLIITGNSMLSTPKFGRRKIVKD